jgi:nucleotide-binding universal stress UspA family protein
MWQGCVLVSARSAALAANARHVIMGHERTLIKRVLFATDFSPCADHAEQHVAFLSKVYGATVDVIHALEAYADMYATLQDHRETDERVADAVRRLQQPGIPVTGHQMMGIPSVLICDAAVKSHADLIVLGTHGRTGLEHVLLGSTAERVLTMAPCPVLTVRQPKGSEGPPKEVPITFQHVTVPIDFSDCSLDALEYAIQLAKDFSASLTLLHVLEPVSYGVALSLGHQAERDQEGATSHLTALASRIQSHGLSVREVIRGGLPADAIIEFAHAARCNLLVMGTHGRRGIAHVLQGSVAEAVLRRAACPVLAVKRLALASGHQRVVRLPAVPVGVGDDVRKAGTTPGAWSSRTKKRSIPFLPSGWFSLKSHRVVVLTLMDWWPFLWCYSLDRVRGLSVATGI